MTTDNTVSFARPHRTRFMRMFNGGGRLLRRCGLRPSLGEARAIAKARRWAKVGALQAHDLAEWRALRKADVREERVRTPLRLLLEDIQDDPTLTPLGRLLARGSIVTPLSARMRVQVLRERQPEIFDREVPRPLVVIGFSRTGTTLLYNLLAQDPAARAPRLWETTAPVPPPDPDDGKDPRIKRAARLVRAVERMAPGIEAAHAVDSYGPEEDLPLLANAFLNPWQAWFDAKRYREWYGGLTEDDAVVAYEEHRAQLQILQWRRPAGHWVLKQAGHQFFLGALLRVYPGACLIQTHRDPGVSLPSLASLAAFYRGIVTDNVDLQRIGRATLNGFVEASRRSLEVRQRLGEGSFFDVSYERLVGDPLGVVGEIYEHFGLPRAPEHEPRMQAWLDENRQHRRGLHRYSLEQFGLDAATVSRETAFYCERFAEFLPAPVAI